MTCLAKTAWSVAIFLALAAGAPALTPKEINREFDFMSKLIGNGFPDLAERVLDQLLRQNPEQKDRAKVVQVEILMSRGKYPDAEKIVRELPANSPIVDEMKLTMANAYYRSRDIEKSKQLYREFFAKYKTNPPKDPNLERFYVEAAYRYSQMLVLVGDYKGAAEAMEIILTTKPDEDMMKRILVEAADLYMRAAKGAEGAEKEAVLKKADALCTKVIWMGPDLWFGRAVATRANIEMARGDENAALKLIRTNMDIMKQIDDQLAEERIPMSISPMADVRHLTATVNERKARAALKANNRKEAEERFAEAIRDYVAVMSRYGESKWGPDAFLATLRVKEELEKLGKIVKIDIRKYEDTVVAGMYRAAEGFFMQKKWDEASKNYLRILNYFPRTDKAISLFSNLIQCFANLDDKLMVQVVGAQVAERYAGNDTAAMALLAGGKFFLDKKDTEMYVKLYDLYVRNFPKHPSVPGILYNLSELLKQSDPKKSKEYQEILLKNYSNDSTVFAALAKQASDFYAASNYQAAADAFLQVIGTSTPNHQRALAQYSLANCYLALTNFAEAVKTIRTLQEWIAPAPNNPYGAVSSEIEKNRELMETSTYLLGYALIRMPGTEAETKKNREDAIAMLEDFLKKYPASKLAPKTMNLIGTAYLAMNQVEKSKAVFDDLSKKYPASDEGKGALFQLLQAEIDIDRPDLAKTTYAEIKADKAKFSVDQFVRLGESLLRGKLYAEASDAFEMVVKESKDRDMLERSLYGLGQSQYHLKKFEDAVKTFEDMMQKYPSSGLFFEVRMLLSKSYFALDQFDKAIEQLDEMTGALMRIKGAPASLNLQISLEAANINIKKAKQLEATNKTASVLTLKTALASVRRNTQRGPVAVKDPALRPFVEESFFKAFELYDAWEALATDDEKRIIYDQQLRLCDSFDELFPNHPKLAEIRQRKQSVTFKSNSLAPAPAPGPAAGPSK